MTLEQAVLDTLRYSAQFKYPLTSKEVHKYLIFSKKAGYKEVLRTLDILVKKNKILKEGNYYLFSKSPTWVEHRLESEKKVKKLLLKTQEDLKFFNKVFFIKFVGVTGSVAANNINSYYDVDLFFILQKNFLWIGRFFIWLYFKLKKVYRLPYCPNILISQDSLVWDKKNIYIANEIARMIPLINKDKTYESFLNKNKWVLRFLPNFDYFIPRIKYLNHNSFLSYLAYPLEIIFFISQYFYMKPKITTERVSFKKILFFKNDYSDKILNNFYQST